MSSWEAKGPVSIHIKNYYRKKNLQTWSWPRAEVRMSHLTALLFSPVNHRPLDSSRSANTGEMLCCTCSGWSELCLQASG